MISEMLKVRDGRIRRILARTSALSVTRNIARGEAGLSNCEANGRAFQGCVRFKKLDDLALDVVGRTVIALRRSVIAVAQRYRRCRYH